MADLPSQSDLTRIARTEALFRNPALTTAEIDRQGSDLNIMVAAGVAVGMELVAQLAAARASQNYGTAKGQALRRLVFDRTGGQITPKVAAPSATSVNFTTTLGTSVNVTIPQGTVLQLPSGQQFVTTALATLLAGGFGPIAVPIRSVLAGADQQIPANQSFSIASQIVNAPTDFVVTNPLASFGADDAETDQNLVTRAQQFFVNAQKGTLGAIASGALAVPGVRTASTFEYVDPGGYPARGVQLVVADAYTDSLAVLTAPPLSYMTQAATVLSTINVSLADFRCGGIAVVGFVAQVVLLQINVAVALQANADPVAVPAAIQAAVVSYINGLSPGAPLRVANLNAVIGQVPGIITTGSGNSFVLSPLADMIATQLQVFRTTVALVKVS